MFMFIYIYVCMCVRVCMNVLYTSNIHICVQCVFVLNGHVRSLLDHGRACCRYIPTQSETVDFQLAKLQVGSYYTFPTLCSKALEGSLMPKKLLHRALGSCSSSREI